MAVAGAESWIVAMPPSRTLSAYQILFVHSLSLAHLTARGLAPLIDVVPPRPSGSRCIRVAWEEGGGGSMPGEAASYFGTIILMLCRR